MVSLPLAFKYIANVETNTSVLVVTGGDEKGRRKSRGGDDKEREKRITNFEQVEEFKMKEDED